MKIKCAHDELLDVSKLVPHPQNPNKHPDNQIDRLAKIIDYQGQRSPIVIDKKTGFIVVGHGRAQAIQKLGWEKAAVNFQEFENEAQLYAHMTADNAIAEWAALDLSQINLDIVDLGPDLDIEMLGLEDFEIEPLDKLEPQSDEDAVPEVDHAITRRGDIWLLGKHRVMCGDSTMIDDVEKLMNGEKADMVFTDPPYGVDYDGGHATEKRREKLANDDDVNMYDLPIKNAFIYSTDNACLYLWFADRFASDVIYGVTDAGYSIRNWIIWNKNVAQFGAIGAQYKSKHEPCIYAFKKGKKVNWCGSNNQITVWDINRDHKNDHHPTQKPVLLSEKAFGNHSVAKVLDLFGGSGSTLISSEKNNKKSFTMELSEKYCDVIINRWQNYTGKQATLESTGQTYEQLKQERENGAT